MLAHFSLPRGQRCGTLLPFLFFSCFLFVFCASRPLLDQIFLRFWRFPAPSLMPCSHHFLVIPRARFRYLTAACFHFAGWWGYAKRQEYNSGRAKVNMLQIGFLIFNFFVWVFFDFLIFYPAGSRNFAPDGGVERSNGPFWGHFVKNNLCPHWFPFTQYLYIYTQDFLSSGKAIAHLTKIGKKKLEFPGGSWATQEPTGTAQNSKNLFFMWVLSQFWRVRNQRKSW